MLAKELINPDFTPLQPSGTIAEAISLMEVWDTATIPVVEPTTRKIAGQVTVRDLSGEKEHSRPVSDLELKNPVYILEDQHIFEAARQMLQHEIRLLPIVDRNETYVGVIEKKKVLEALSHMLNVTTSGSVITVEIHKADFTLSEIVYLIETEGAKILGLTVEQADNSESTLHVSIKLNQSKTSAVVSSLQRHGYVTAVQNRNDVLEMDITSRADELMRYLDV
ncbi:MAG: CBS domain-containing protein [Balneolaceae bacterium]|nr:CBS domain-containing protein [Balneolaceae bacterium]MCH8548071.1 CBS domain-containing protein [Balneolaceae bacterium]